MPSTLTKEMANVSTAKIMSNQFMMYSIIQYDDDVSYSVTICEMQLADFKNDVKFDKIRWSTHSSPA